MMNNDVYVSYAALLQVLANYGDFSYSNVKLISIPIFLPSNCPENSMRPIGSRSFPFPCTSLH